MRKLYLVALGPSLNREVSINRLMSLGQCGPWFYSIPNTFCIYSQLKARAIFEALHNPLDPKENLIVTEMPTANSMGWLPKRHCDCIRDNFVVHDYTLQFVGYWIDEKRSLLPETSGIYCVYSCIPQQNNSLNVTRLLYIGKANNIRERHQNHKKHDFWLACAGIGQTLCYSYAPMARNSLSVCEAALIYRHQPPCNEACTESFLHSTTRVHTSGANLYLAEDFILNRTEGEEML